MIDERRRIFIELTKEATDEEKAVILELLKEDNCDSRATPIPIAAARFLIAYVLSLGLFLVEMLCIAVSDKRDSKAWSPLLFGASSERNTTNLHLQRLLDSTNMHFDILILESPIKRFEQQLKDLGNTRTLWCRTIPTDLNAIVQYVRTFGRLRSAAVKISRYRRLNIRNTAMVLVRLLRGMSISRFLARKQATRLVFSLSGNACTSIIELQLKGITKTIHWLHGVGLGFNFDSFSDLTLVNNEYDYLFYREGLCGQSKFFPEISRTFFVPAGVEAIEAVVVYSNLIHPNSNHFEEMGIDVERDLLRTVSAKFAGKDLVVRPHPSSVPLLGNRLDEYLDLLRQYGFRVSTETDNSAPESTLYISTVSTSFIDLVAAGKCVLMYDRFANKLSGFQDHVSQALRFRDERSFKGALGLLESPSELISALKSFVVQSQDDAFNYLLNVSSQTRTKPK